METDPSWTDHAACRGVPLPVFFPTNPKNARAYTIARGICANCTVLDQCREENDRLEANSPWDAHGLRAGETVTQRLARRRGRKPRAFKVSPVFA